MTKEEKKAIEFLKDMNDGFTFQDCRVCIEDNKYNEKTGICESKTCDYLNSITTVLNLIQKQDTEINKLKEENERLKYSCAKATKIIDEYTNETEMDTKKLIEYQEKYLNNK